MDGEVEDEGERMAEVEGGLGRGFSWWVASRLRVGSDEDNERVREQRVVGGPLTIGRAVSWREFR